MRRMLINAQHPEQLRVAVVSDRSLESYQVEVAESGLARGNIYRGTIANVQPGLNAAFIDYGADRHGFLSIQDVVPQAWYREPAGPHPRIEEVLERNKPIVVQVAKDAVGGKGAVMTTNLSLAGRYLVLTPFEDTRGVSRKVEDEEMRKKLKQLAARLELPAGSGVIVRTNALDQTKATLARDLAALLRLWKRVQSEATKGGTRLLYTDQDLIVQALRDHLDSSIEEVLVDDDDAFARAQRYMQAFMPRGRTRLARYEERLPLFSRYDVERQIDSIYERRVELPTGGSIVIDPTEALTAIDVNSGRSTKAATQEETAVNTNLEAAREVARQLRLRDIGGLVVVDFIDMRASKNQRKVEKVLKDAMREDKARSTVGRISANGLLEINRQRIRQALALRTHRPCPTCAGTGAIASPEMVALNLLRRVEARAATGMVEKVRIALHPELADAFQNGRRKELAQLEQEFDLEVEINASPALHRAEERVEWTDREKPHLPQRPARPPRPVLQAADVAFEEEEEEEEWEEEPEEAARPAGAPAGGEAALARKKKRRRGGRKRKKNGGGEQRHEHRAAEHPQRPERPQGRTERRAAPEPAEAEPPMEGVEVEAEPAGAEDGAGKRGKRRRGRRRRGGRRPGGGAEAGGNDGEAAPLPPPYEAPEP